jgi:hypothetical protein
MVSLPPFPSHPSMSDIRQDKMTKSDLYACKSLMSSAHLTLTQSLEKNQKSQDSIPDLSKLTEYLKEFERSYEAKA